MHRACAAEGDEGEVARLDSLLDRERPDRLRHLRVDHRDDPLGQLGDPEAELLAEPGDRGAGGRGVERHAAARERLRIDPAEHEVGVGHRRAGAAAAVAGRAGIGAGALRADAQPSGLGIGDRAAAGADRVDVRDRHQQREALERRLGRDVGLARDHEADVEARPAHVDADQVRAVERAGQGDEAHRPADRPGEQRLQRPLPRRLGGHDPAARLHDVQRNREPLPLHLGLQPFQVAADRRRGVRLDHRGGRPLVLSPLAGDAVRERDRHSVELLEQDLLDAKLVLRIEEAEEQRDGDRPEALVARPGSRGTHGRLVERHPLLAAPVEASRDLDDVAQRHERLRLAVVEVVEPGAVSARDVVDVAGSLGREEQHLLAAALEKGVEADGRSVDGEADRGGRVDHLPEPGEHPFGEVVRRRGRLAGRVRPAFLVVRDDVGERPSYVHRNAVPAHLAPFRRRPRDAHPVLIFLLTAT